MATKTSICNMALTHISAKNILSDIETDASIEAKTCRIFYESALEFVLTQNDWGFAVARKALSELSDTAPADWSYIYSYPNDCIKTRAIYTSSRRTGVEDIPFEIGLDSTGTIKAILTDEYQAYLRYTKNITDSNLFPPAFVIALSYYLANLIAMPLTKKQSIKNDMTQAFKEFMSTAQATDADEDNMFEDKPDSEFIRCR